MSWRVGWRVRYDACFSRSVATALPGVTTALVASCTSPCTSSSSAPSSASACRMTDRVRQRCGATARVPASETSRNHLGTISEPSLERFGTATLAACLSPDKHTLSEAAYVPKQPPPLAKSERTSGPPSSRFATLCCTFSTRARSWVDSRVVAARAVTPSWCWWCACGRGRGLGLRLGPFGA